MLATDTVFENGAIVNEVANCVGKRWHHKFFWREIMAFSENVESKLTRE